MSTPLIELSFMTIATNGTALVYHTESTVTTFQASFDGNHIPDFIFQALVSLTDTDASNNNAVDCSWHDSDIQLSFGFGSNNETEIWMPLSNFILYAIYQDMTPVEPPSCYLAFDNYSANDYVWLGTSFMQSAYLVFDYDSQEISIAPVKDGVPKGLPQSVSVVNITAGQPNTLFSTVRPVTSSVTAVTIDLSVSVTPSNGGLITTSSSATSKIPASTVQQSSSAAITTVTQSGIAPVIVSVNLVSSTIAGNTNPSAISPATRDIREIGTLWSSVLIFSLILSLI